MCFVAVRAHASGSRPAGSDRATGSRRGRAARRPGGRRDARPARDADPATRPRSGSRSRSACGCSASAARRARASGAACARRRRPSGRRGPSRSPTRAGRSPRAAAPGPRRPPSSWISSNSRRVRSTLRAGHEGLELVGADLELAGHDRAGLDARRLGAPAPPRDGLGARDQLLRVAGLGDPVVGAQPQPAHALGHRRAAGADDHAQRRQPLADLLEVAPARGAEHGEVDHEHVEPHRHERVGRHGAREHAVLPARGVEPVREHLQEARVGIEHRRGARVAGRSVDAIAQRRIVAPGDAVTSSGRARNTLVTS